MLLVDVCMRMFLVKLLSESAKTEMSRRLPAKDCSRTIDGGALTAWPPAFSDRSRPPAADLIAGGTVFCTWKLDVLAIRTRVSASCVSPVADSDGRGRRPGSRKRNKSEELLHAVSRKCHSSFGRYSQNERLRHDAACSPAAEPIETLQT